MAALLDCKLYLFCTRRAWFSFQFTWCKAGGTQLKSRELHWNETGVIERRIRLLQNAKSVVTLCCYSHSLFTSIIHSVCNLQHCFCSHSFCPMTEISKRVASLFPGLDLPHNALVSSKNLPMFYYSYFREDCVLKEVGKIESFQLGDWDCSVPLKYLLKATRSKWQHCRLMIEGTAPMFNN